MWVAGPTVSFQTKVGAGITGKEPPSVCWKALHGGAMLSHPLSQKSPDIW